MSIITIKRRRTGAVGPPSSLYNGELAFNEVDDTLYYGKGLANSAGGAIQVVPIGGVGSYVDKKSAQTITGIKTFGVSPLVPTKSATDNSGAAASTGFVALQFPTITPGTYTKVDVNSKGLVTQGSAINSTDIADFTDAVLAATNGGTKKVASIKDFASTVRTIVSAMTISGGTVTPETLPYTDGLKAADFSDFQTSVRDIVTTMTINGASTDVYDTVVDNSGGTVLISTILDFAPAVRNVVNAMTIDGSINVVAGIMSTSIIDFESRVLQILGASTINANSSAKATIG
jgi:hypothetical protein